MIKLLGVITSAGLPVKIESFIEIEHEEFFAGLVEAVKAISKVLGKDVVKEIEFKKDKLLITESEKGYIVVGLVDVAEAYIRELLKYIARKIDESDVPPHSGIIDNWIVGVISDILNRYIKRTIDIDMLTIMEKIWDPMFEIIVSSPKALGIIESAKKEINKYIEEYQRRWRSLVSKYMYDFKLALENASKFRFDLASASLLKNDSSLARNFAIRTGIMAMSVAFMPFPSFDELERIASVLPDDTFSKLTKTSLEHIFRGADLSEYLNALEVALKEFEWGEGLEDLAKAHLLWSGYISFYPDYARRLIEYFGDKSPAISDLIRIYIEVGEILDKIYSITSYSDVRELVMTWRARIGKILEETDKILKFVWLKKKLGLISVEDAQKIILNMAKIRHYLDILTLLIDSPIVGPMEKLEIVDEVLRICQKYLQTVIKNKVYCFISDILGIMMNYALTLSYLYFVYSDKREDIIKKIKQAYKLLWILVAHEYGRIGSYYATYLSAILSFLGFPISIHGEICPEELKLVYVASKLFDPRTSERFSKGHPYTYAVDIENMSSILASLATRILKEPSKTKILKDTINILIDTYKWFIFQGKVGRESTMLIIYYASKIIDKLSREELEKIADFILMLTNITVPNWEKNDYELAILCESGLIELLLTMSKKLGDKKYADTAKKILEISIEAWRKYGFQRKADELKKKYLEYEIE